MTKRSYAAPQCTGVGKINSASLMTPVLRRAIDASTTGHTASSDQQNQPVDAHHDLRRRRPAPPLKLQ